MLLAGDQVIIEDIEEKLQLYVHELSTDFYLKIVNIFIRSFTRNLKFLVTIS